MLIFGGEESMNNFSDTQLVTLNAIKKVNEAIDDLYFELCFDDADSVSFNNNINNLKICFEVEDSLYNRLQINRNNMTNMLYVICGREVNSLFDIYEHILDNDFIERIEMRITKKIFERYMNEHFSNMEKKNQVDKSYLFYSIAQFTNIIKRDFYNIFLKFLRNDMNRELRFNLAFIDDRYEKEMVSRNFELDKSGLLLSSFCTEEYEEYTNIKDAYSFASCLNRSMLDKILVGMPKFINLPDKIFNGDYDAILDIYSAFFQTCFVLMDRYTRIKVLYDWSMKTPFYEKFAKEKYEFFQNLLYQISLNDNDDSLIIRKK